MKRAIISTLMLFACILLYGQESIDIERLLEQNDVILVQKDFEDIVATLLYLNNNPLHLNTTTYDSLKLLIFISDSQIDNIIQFRKTYGGFRNINELLLVPGISKRDIENIRHFIVISDFGSHERREVIRKMTKQELIARIKTSLPKQAGYKRYSRDAFIKESDYQKHLRNRFNGPPWGTMIKYKLNTGSHIEAGITLENDAGESYFTRYQRTGFDFISAHISATTSGLFKRIIIGDFKVQFGQGVIAWQGFSTGKSAATLSNEKSGKGTMPYTSTDENNYLRGLALTLAPAKNITTTLFISYKKIDGNLFARDTIDPEDIETASLYQSGYHRSISEGEKKHTIKEFTTGISVNYNHRSFRVGTQAIYYNFNPPFRPGTQSYQQYNDTGSKRKLVSIDYKSGFYDFYLFGETAISDNGTFGTINGVRYSGYSRASFSMVYRNHNKRFISHYNGSFGEYSNGSNEEGLYLGMESNLFRNLKINAYYDWFRCTSSRYRATIPGAGNELLTEIVWLFNKKSLTFRIKREAKPEDLKVDKETISVKRIREDYRLQLTIAQWRIIELRSRLDYSIYRKNSIKECGFSLYQDVILTLKNPDIKAQFRLAWFDTDSYNARIYTYEHNVLYGYSFPAYYDKGLRTYININWKPTKKLTLYLKGGFTWYKDRDHISSGTTLVEGNKLYDLSAQLRLKF